MGLPPSRGWLVFLLILMIPITQIYPAILHCESDELQDILFYMYGLTTCPHCRALDSFFNQTFPNKYVKCWVDLDSTCYSNLVNLYRDMVKNYSVPEELLGVPTTLVIKMGSNGNTTLAIVIGEVKNKDFWLQLTKLEPSPAPRIYIGEKLFGPTTTTQANNSLLPTTTTQTDNSLLLSIGVILVVSIAIAMYFISLRRR
ncbi:MAG: hypothetical protein LM589_05390 [Thermosphaera sp.]|nr:hypothetical protein [Thermosphaera sp.]